jgi:propanol-preferring alcohol dehydrogenase
MLAVHFRGQGKIELHEVPTPEPRGNQVLVRIHAAGICGTDRESLEGQGQTTIPGHENAGEIAAVDKPAWAKAGDRVAINCHVTCGACEHCLRGDLYFCDQLSIIGFDHNGGFADCILVPESCCMPLPADIPLEVGALMVDVFGTAFRAVKRARLFWGDRIAVWGAGPVGLEVLLVASRFGAQVAVVDINEMRLEMARRLGAGLVLNPDKDDVQTQLMEWSSGRGLAVAFECSGTEKAALQALPVIQKRGILALVGVSHSLTLNPWQLIGQELTIFATRNFNTQEFGEMAALVQRGLPVDQVITHRYPISHADEAFRVFRSGQGSKIVLTI